MPVLACHPAGRLAQGLERDHMPGVLLAALAASRKGRDHGMQDRKPARGRSARRKPRKARRR